MSADYLTVRGVDVRFGGVHALRGVSIDHQPGEVLGLIGPNGAGKTTLLNVITGLVRASAGEVTFAGRTLTAQSPQDTLACGVVRTFQNTELYAGLNVRDNVMLGCHLRVGYGFFRALVGFGRARTRERELRVEVDEVLDQLGLLGYADEGVTELPYGVRKRLELARALVLRPRVLLLDEPAAGATSEDRDGLVNDVQRITRELKASVILIEHDMRLVMSMCDRVAVLNWGSVLAVGTPAEIQANVEVEAAYLGR